MHLLDLLPSDVRKQRVLPILRDHVTPFDVDTVMQACVAKSFGHILQTVSSPHAPCSAMRLSYGVASPLSAVPRIASARSGAASKRRARRRRVQYGDAAT